MAELKRTQKLFQQDVRAITGMAQEVLRQCRFYERHGVGDEIRFMLIDTGARRLAKRSARARRRYLLPTTPRAERTE